MALLGNNNKGLNSKSKSKNKNSDMNLNTDIQHENIVHDTNKKPATIYTNKKTTNKLKAFKLINNESISNIIDDLISDKVSNMNSKQLKTYNDAVNVVETQEKLKNKFNK